MTRGIYRAIPDSLALERDGVLELVQTQACRNLIRMFFLQEHARKFAVIAGETKSVSRAAVIGAGVMGAGIAQWLSSPTIAGNSAGCQHRAGGERHGHHRQNVSRRDQTSYFHSRLKRGLDWIGYFPRQGTFPLRHVDLVIEAAVENLEVKKKIFLRLDELAGEETILATNTSALPVSELAAATRRPERVVGLHFFNPVHRMQLVEIIAARQTAPEVLQRAVKCAQTIGKMPVVVKDSPGFLVNRILMPYLIEAGNLFEGGADVAALDEAMLDFGMPMGPMRLMDEVGLDVSLHVAKFLAAKFSDRMSVPAALDKMFESEIAWVQERERILPGTTQPGQPSLNPQVSTFVTNTNARGLPREELEERMVFLMVNEAARCLEEQIVAGPAEIDFAMIMGTGFAPFLHGGPRCATPTRSAWKKSPARWTLWWTVARAILNPAPCCGIWPLAGKPFIPKLETL